MLQHTNIFCKVHNSLGELVRVHGGERAYVFDAKMQVKKELSWGDTVRILPGESVFRFRESVEFHLDFPDQTRNTHMTFHVKNSNPLRYSLQLNGCEIITIETLQQKILDRKVVAQLEGQLDKLNEAQVRDLLSSSFASYGLFMERICITREPLESFRKDPELQPDLSVSGCTAIPINFVYEDKQFTATLHVPQKLISGAAKTPRLLGGVPNDFSAFCLDASQDVLYDVLLEYFDEIKETYSLNNNQYVSLVTCYVQSLKYDYSRKSSKSPQYYPLETVAHGKGVCSDTALLLAGLLAKRDYDVAYIAFPAEKHGVAGIRVKDGQGFRGSDYLTIDTTDKYEIGYCPPSITSLPIVTKIGNGALRYESEEW